MRLLSVEDLDAAAGDYDAAVAASAYIDRFCSSSAWVLPAVRALMDERAPWIHRDADAWVAMMRGRHDRGFRYVEPLEATWGLSSPVVGVDGAAASELLAELARATERTWDVMVLSGVLDAAPWKRPLLALLAQRYDVRMGGVTQRHVASLAGGLDGYMSRRTRNFRRSVTRAVRRVRDAGIALELVADASDPDALYARVQDVEARSWKGHAKIGIDVGRMRDFYALMTRRLAASGRLRLLFARRDDRDVAYVLGGVLGDTYRGLQFSFDASLSELGLGNACQHEQIRLLCDEGVGRYDLGTTGIGYKTRWAEDTEDSTVLIAVRR